MIKEGLGIKKITIFVLSFLLVLVGLSFSNVTAAASDGESNDVLTDANEAP